MSFKCHKFNLNKQIKISYDWYYTDIKAWIWKEDKEYFKEKNKDHKYDKFREFLMNNCKHYYELSIVNLIDKDRYGVVELLAYRIIM